MKLRNGPCLLSLTLSAALLTAAAPATKPAAVPAPPLDSVGNELVQFVAPVGPDWVRQTKDDPDVVYFVHGHGDGEIEVRLAKKDFQLSPDIAPEMAGAIAKQLKENRQAKKLPMLLEPKVLHDRRFDITIHERFKIGEHVEDELHLYRSVGPRVVMVTVSSISSDAAVVVATLKAGEDLMDKAKYNGRAFKR